MNNGVVRARCDGAAATWVAAAFVAAVVIALTGTGAVVARVTAPVPSPRHVVAAQPPAVETLPHVTSPAGEPRRVRIPAIGVNASLVRLGLNADATLEVPHYEDAGWYGGGTRPGDPGPAVIVAHVDSTSGPAVFYRLEELDPGDAVHVEYGDGTVTFTVRESKTYAKSGFPTALVYGSTDRPELRLVTCDGTFDRKARAYDSNLIVWADIAGPA